MSERIDDQHRVPAAGNGDGSGRYGVCAYVQDLAAGFALGALDEDDHQTVVDHMAECSRCSWIISEAKQTAALLPFSTMTTTPPPPAKAALFSRIAQSSRTVTADVLAPSLTIPASNPASTGAQTPERRWRLPHFGRPDSSRPSRLYLPLLATVPLVIALALVGGFALTSQNDVENLRAQLFSVRQDLSDTQDSLDTVDDFTAQADTTVYALPGDAGSGDGEAHGTVLANPGTTEAILLVAGLEDRPKNCVYEVWLEGQDGFMTRVAEFGVDAEGRSAVKLALDQPFDNFMTLHVRRRDGVNDVINTDVIPRDAIYAQIAPDLDRIVDHIGAGAE